MSRRCLTLRTLLSALVPGSFVGCGPLERTIAGVATDSRTVRPGDLFVAVPGTRTDGCRFVSDALARGAAGVLMARSHLVYPLAPGMEAVPVVGVDEPGRAAGLLSGAIFGEPSRQVTLVGVTGTNGKTTVSFLLEGIWEAAGLLPGVIGTVSQRCAGQEIAAELTTPEAVRLQALLAAMCEQRADAVALEVSSHALDQDRIAGCHFSAGVFTNLSRDHLDYHRDMEIYFQAKARLFMEHSPELVILNIDDFYGARLWSMVPGPKVSYGFAPEAMVRPVAWHQDAEGVVAKLMTMQGVLDVRTSMIGRHNLANALAAAATALALGVDPVAVTKGIEAVRSVPGRLERVESPSGVLALVDYAHTPAALEGVLGALAELGPERLICVVGCGGDRDRGKRPLMARAGAAGADLLVLTSDNPRTEYPRAILDEMEAGLEALTPRDSTRCSEVKVIVDRREAIVWAAGQTRPGDCLVVAGKGHEIYQIVGSSRIPFDDRLILRDALRHPVESRLAVLAD